MKSSAELIALPVVTVPPVPASKLFASSSVPLVASLRIKNFDSITEPEGVKSWSAMFARFAIPSKAIATAFPRIE